MTESYTDQADQHPSLVKPAKKIFCRFNKNMIERCIRDMLLQGMCVEVRIPYLDSNTGSQLFFMPEFIGKFLNHCYKQFPEINYINGIFLKGPFRAD